MYQHIAIKAAILAARQLDERAKYKGYQLRIEYSQNGHVITDELFEVVSFFYTGAERQAAMTAALALVDEHGCGTAAVYVTPADHSSRTYLGTMNFPLRSRRI